MGWKQDPNQAYRLHPGGSRRLYLLHSFWTPAMWVLQLGVVVGAEEGEGDGAVAVAPDRFAWYTPGMSIERYNPLGHPSLYYSLVMFGRVRWPSWGSRDEGKKI